MTRRRPPHRHLSHGLAICALTLASACQQKEPALSSGVTEVTNSHSVDSGIIRCDVPSDWEVLSGAEESVVRKQTKRSIDKMIEGFERASGLDQVYLGLETFRAVKMPRGTGWLLAYTTRIPTQSDYLTTLEEDQKRKIAWGLQQGFVTRVLESGRTRVGGADVVKVDTVMRKGGRCIGLYSWSASSPDRVGTLSLIVNAGHEDDVRSAIESVMSSLEVQSEPLPR